MAPLKFFGALSTTNKSGKDVTFHTANDSIKFTIEAGVTADMSNTDDETKANSIFNVRFGKEAKEVFSLTTESSWPKEVLFATLTWEDGFLTIKGTKEKDSDVVRARAVFNKKGPAA